MPADKAPTVGIAIRQIRTNNGTVRTTLSHASFLQAAGHRVVVITEKVGEAAARLLQEADVDCVTTTPWPLRGFFRRKWFDSRVDAVRKRKQVDVLISHGDARTDDIIYVHNCVHLAARRTTGRCLPENDEVGRWFDYILAGGRYRTVIANSWLMKKDLMARYRIHESKIAVCHPASDVRVCHAENRDARRDATRARLGIGRDEVLVGLVTSGDFRKRNVRLFIEAAARAQSRQPGTRWRFLVVGKDDFADYRRCADRAGLGQALMHVPFMAGIADVYPALDLFVLPAHIEEFGQVAMEAMLCASPVVLSDQVGATEVVAQEPEMAGRILPPEDPGRWAQAMLDSVNDPQAADKALQLAKKLRAWNIAQREAGHGLLLAQVRP